MRQRELDLPDKYPRAVSRLLPWLHCSQSAERAKEDTDLLLCSDISETRGFFSPLMGAGVPSRLLQVSSDAHSAACLPGTVCLQVSRKTHVYFQGICETLGCAHG